jgi:phage-related protein
LVTGHLNLWGTVASFFGDIGWKILGFIGNLGSTLYNKGVEIIQGFVNGINAMISFGFGAVRNLGSTILNAVGNLGSTLYWAGRDVIEGFIDGIRDAIGGVQNVLGGLTSKLTSWKGPPSKDKRILISSGEYVIEGFIAGLKSRFPDVQTALGGLTNSLSVGGNLGSLSASPINSNLVGVGRGSSPIININNQNNTNADPGEIAAATAFRLITSGAL